MPLRRIMLRMLVLLLAGTSLPAWAPAQMPTATPGTPGLGTVSSGTAGAIAVTPGIDTLLADPTILRGRRVGLVTHPAGITADGRPTASVLAQVPGLRLAALFAPEHGIDGTYDAGEPVPTLPGRTPVFSLYGGAFRPTQQMLARVDVLVLDLQDVGVRAYTYTSTMALVMEAARDARIPVVVLDRPNPLGGLVMDGPVLEPRFRSFIGLHPIPYIFGMTIGELAQLYNRAFGLDVKLTVIPMQGWTRRLTWADTQGPWVNPSPGITGPDVISGYAATGAVDGTNLWNGVATESRFKVVLARWIDGAVLVERLARHGLPGVTFTPSALPHPRTGEVWRGVRLHITDPAAFLPSTTIVHILAEIRSLYGDRLIFRRPRRGDYLFDKVWGTKDVRLALQRGEPAAAIVARWQPGLRRFDRLREPYLLYR